MRRRATGTRVDLMLERSAKELRRARPGSVLVVGESLTRMADRWRAITRIRVDATRTSCFTPSMKTARVSSSIISLNLVRMARPWMAAAISSTIGAIGSGAVVGSRPARGAQSYFISRPLRQRLIAYALKLPAFKKYVTEVSALLKQPEDAEPHDDHFHVRVSCPNGQSEICHERSK